MKIRIGHKLLSIRTRKNQSQAEFADLLNMSASAYARLERDETSMEFEKLPSIADALQVPLQDILPENISINNSNSHSGDGSCSLIMSTFYYYGNSDGRIALLEEENKFLKEKIVFIEE